MTFAPNDQKANPTPRPPAHIPNSDFTAWSQWLHSVNPPEGVYVSAFAAIEKVLPPRAGEGINSDLEIISKEIRKILWNANFTARFARDDPDTYFPPGEISQRGRGRWRPGESKALGRGRKEIS